MVLNLVYGRIGRQSFVRLQDMVKEGRILFFSPNRDCLCVNHAILFLTMKPISKNVGFAFAVSTLVFACATRQPPAEPSPEKATEKPEVAQATDPVAKLQERIQDLEIRLAALNDKINLENGAQITTPPANAKPHVAPETADTEAAPEAATPVPKATTKSSVKPSKKEVSKVTVNVPAAHAHAVPNFVQDEAIDRYREAKILFDSKRNADAIVEFSSFIKTYPDHTLAAAAQFFIGMGYYEQGEFKLAEEEFSRGLIAYPHSEYVPDTLLALASVSSKLKKTARVTYYKQKLLSSFPNSPQAKGITLDSKDAASEEVEEEAPRTSRPAAKAPIAPEAPVAPTAPAAEESHE